MSRRMEVHGGWATFAADVMPAEVRPPSGRSQVTVFVAARSRAEARRALLAAGIQLSESHMRSYWSTWGHGAPGYHQAMARPLVVHVCPMDLGRRDVILPIEPKASA